MAMRKPTFIRYIEDPDNKGGDGGKGGGGSDKGHEHGFPKDTPVVEMTSEQQIAYWKYHSRKHEGTVNARADYDQQKADAEKWRQHEKDNKPADQKVIDDEKERARNEERSKLAPRLVKAEFKAAAAGVVPKELLEAFLEDVNHSVYLKPDGEIDTDKIQTRVTALTPKDNSRRQTHQGYRPNDGATSVVNGRDLFKSRNKKG